MAVKVKVISRHVSRYVVVEVAPQRVSELLGMMSLADAHSFADGRKEYEIRPVGEPLPFVEKRA